MAGAGGFAMLIALSTVDAFSVGSFVAPRAGLPLAGKAGGLCARSALASPRRVLGLQMSEGLEQEERIRVARKLAEDAKAAMDSAKEAEAKANTKLGGVFYRQWTGLLTGRGDGVGKDPLGLDDSFYSQGPEQRATTIKAVFASFDKDGNGSIDDAELRAGVKEVLGYDALGTGEVEALMQEADLNKSGSIEIDEFLTMVSLVLDKGEAQVLEASQKADAAARTKARVEMTASMVKDALTSVI
ncbi:hypothetical protein T484DRAFT_1761449 [Baffinella frigidus]|nr:hypothetical protein T484DRAFT_1761449 [Cryptophyta sp. CCMP2293]